MLLYIKTIQYLVGRWYMLNMWIIYYIKYICG